MTAVAFVEWINHFAKFKPSGKVLLIFDGAASHLDANIVEAAETNDIVLYCLPSNTTHALQPMDVSCFKPYESYWDDEVLRYWDRKGERRITKQVFAEIFGRIWPKAMTPSNIMSGFRGTGIYPFLPDAIRPEFFAPSDVTERPDEQCDDLRDEPSTPETSQPLPSANIVDLSHFPELPSDDEDDEMIDDGATVNELSPILPTNELSTATPCEIPPPQETPAPQGTPAPQETTANVSFTQILTTPKVTTGKQRRRKALNYRGTQVTRELFAQAGAEGSSSGTSTVGPKQKKLKKTIKPSDTSTQKKKGKATMKKTQTSKPSRAYEPLPGPSRLQNPDPKVKSSTKNKNESWYCFICQEDYAEDMVLCSVCHTYVHQLCAAYDPREDTLYLCPECEV